MVQLVEAPLTPEGIVFTSTKDVIRSFFPINFVIESLNSN
jgi:hypothetical protein